MMKCITCGKNEAINDFYKECIGCIEKYEKIKSMKFNLSNINIGELIRFKDKLLKSKKINKKEFDIITDYLARFIGELG